MKNDWDATPLDWLLWVLLVLSVAVGIVSFLLIPIAYGQQKRPSTESHTLDLPLDVPKLGGKPFHVPESRMPEPDPPEDDPRDTPPPVFYGEEIDTTSDSLIYVLDRSGSMRMNKKWERARSETTRSVSGLAENLRFDVVTYSSAVEPMWGALREASEDAKAEAVAWLGARTPYGGTETGPAVVGALAEDRSNRSVVLLTDGAPNGGPELHRRFIREGNLQGAVIDCFGVDARGHFRAFLQGVAADSGGSYVDVP